MRSSVRPGLTPPYFQSLTDSDWVDSVPFCPKKSAGHGVCLNTLLVSKPSGCSVLRTTSARKSSHLIQNTSAGARALAGSTEHSSPLRGCGNLNGGHPRLLTTWPAFDVDYELGGKVS